MTVSNAAPNPDIDARSKELLRDDLRSIHQRTDRLFACLMFAQWLGCIAAALWISPRTWIGAWSGTHVHVWVAVLLGGAVASLPILSAILRPGAPLTRHLLAVAQMLMSALLIHLTGGRIETHFHVFGSLALLAAYRDCRVLLTSTIVVVADHAIRGAVWPQSVYGVLAAAPWRTLEHAAWVVFEDFFLFITIRQSVLEMRKIAVQRAMLEATNRLTEDQVRLRTAELQQAKAQLRLIIDSVPTGLLMIDEDGVIKLANSKIEEMFGYRRGQLLGELVESLLPENVRQRHPQLRREYLQAPAVRPMGSGRDMFGMRSDGAEFPVELGLSPLRTDEGTFVLAAVVDITQRKRTETELKAYSTQLEQANRDLTRTKAELEHKNRELDEFTYVASHDLQEPIRKLVSFSKLLQQDIGQELNEQADRDLKFIVDSAGRMRQLVQDLLALSRAGRSAMTKDRVRLDDCCADAEYALQMRIAETKAVIRRDQLPEVIGDRTMLTQLYQNLIGNALKFVAADAPDVSLTVEENGDQWILGVKDNGIGMKPEYAERIFKPFQRLHRRNEYEGTGIGLSICKKTVERHGGQLWVESSPGEGAHFKFMLPKQPETESCHTTERQEHELQSC